ncbi:bifunctional folylpolyglutamate synthase/dihydrofolate synthase [Companilactobacillus sp. HBUAS56275]|uniref:tetrahydrofolate synthase n=1 Tax=Candidatus Companilactobacillus pullicola TaxID=2838523 RepID=A0A9D1ZLF4_9LACO|nr:bifunctional folylpolyglutamate synthase/dihydrofolate synthase [Candidatus Companilactobacillus pullicola]
MVTTGKQAIAWIDSRVKHGSRPGLIRIEELLRLDNNPEKEVRSIHIAGTNGKGSTVMYLRCLLEQKNLTVGTFTSPYIESFYERISIDGQMIPENDFVELSNRFIPLVEQMDQSEKYSGITQFEILTAMAFDYFKNRVDIAIIETGIGGLLDSTNVVHPELAAITTVGLDHTDILGDTIAKIAWQKAGIIKENVPIVSGNIPEEGLEVIQAEANKKNAPSYVWKKDYKTDYLGFKDQFEMFNFQNQYAQFKNLKTPLTGHQQVENAAVAIELFYLYCQKHNYSISIQEIQTALLKVRWPARMEVISQKPLVIMDGAHNPHAIKRLKDNILTEYQDFHIHILFSAITTKNIDSMLEDLLTIQNVDLTLTTFDYPNALHLADYQDLADRITIEPDWKKALGEKMQQLGSDDVLFITGSLYFVSGVRDLLK